MNPAYRFGVKLANASEYYGEVLRMRPGEVLRPIGKGALGGALAGGVYDLWTQHGREGDFDYKQLAKHMGVGGAIGAGIGAIPGARRGHVIAKEQSILDRAGAFHTSDTPAGEHAYSVVTHNGPKNFTDGYNAIAPLAYSPHLPDPREHEVRRIGTRGVYVLSPLGQRPSESYANAPRDAAERAAWVPKARHQMEDHAAKVNDNMRNGQKYYEEYANPMHEDLPLGGKAAKTWRSIIDSLA